ncbi:MAG: iron ABC transporter substrate-binding protein [Tepidimonas sp.]|uniref:iron ABC transporter substrate-binding protein n=1 Tax=Tepidimonas sp. TaxID=2002775 RepID=UPI00259E0E98|nr:iron ABC transporter substrate-binding protein [Tepidimonas sp.]MDM7456339.1 iron ABC transporter substrate-binding protein [Tepidimonas sp.]
MRRRDFLLGLSALTLARHSLAAPATGLHVFGTLPRPEQVQRVFAAGAPAAVLVYCLAADKLMGWPAPLTDEAKNLLAPAARVLPVLGRLAGRGSTLPLEKLVALKPDLIVDAGTVDATYLSTAERVWRATGIPYVLVDGRLADSARQLRETGRLLGVAERGERLARYAETTLITCDNIGGQRRPRVYLARAADGLETALPGSVNGECIEAACGINAAQGTGGNLARVSREQILAWAPEVIVTQYPEFHALARRDDFWRRLPAVRDGRLYLAPALPFGWLDGPPSVNRLIGVRWLAARLHGQAARTEWLEDAREFNALFYGYAPTRDELARRLPELT